MRILDYEITYPHLLLAALITVLGIATIIGLSTSSTAFGAYNSAWDGSQDLRDLTATTDSETVIAQSTATYDEADSNTTTAIIIAPDTNYSTQEVQRISRFLEEGGTLVVAGDVDAASNQLLAELGAATRIEETPVRDSEENYRSPAFPVATNVTEAPLTRNVSQLTLNYPVVLEPGNNASVIVGTSEFSYIDENRDGELNDDEAIGSRPIVASESYGAGRLVVVSDPSIFINTMLAQPDNREFARNLVTAGETVLFDYTHTAELPLAVTIVQTVASSDWLQLTVSGLFVVGLG